jgi:hypothetical protein
MLLSIFFILISSVSYAQSHGPGVPTQNCTIGDAYFKDNTSDGFNGIVYRCTSINVWTTSGVQSFPTGAIVLIITGTCPFGWIEEATLSGVTLIGTVAANADIGTTGGNNNITPTGTVTQPTFTGNSFDNRPAFVKVIFCKK